MTKEITIKTKVWLKDRKMVATIPKGKGIKLGDMVRVYHKQKHKVYKEA